MQLVPAGNVRLATNLSPRERARLPAFATASGFADADLIILGAYGGAKQLKPEDAAAIEARVAQGAALLVTLPEARQQSSMLLGRVLPSITWQVSGQFQGYPSGAISIGWADAEFFPSGKLPGGSLPFFFTVEPMASAERGQSRYACYQRKNPVLANVVQPGDDFWMRPLLLRDVRVRLRADNHETTPLLATARYGAGRTALFGSGFPELSQIDGLLSTILAWLAPGTVTTVTLPSAPEMRLEYHGQSLRLHLRSTTTGPLDVEVVGRAYTWENAPLGFEHDLLRTLTLKRNQVVTVDWVFPEPSATMYQAIEHRNAFNVRLAVLANGGATKLLERELLADFSPVVSLDIRTDNIDTWTYPFHAPGPNFQRLAGERMGAHISAYAYPPGATVKTEVELRNGLRNLGSIATASDETTLDNPSVTSLLGGAIVAGKRPLDGVEAYSVWSGKAETHNVLRFTFRQPVTLASIVLVGDFRGNSFSNPDEVVVEFDRRRLATEGQLAKRFITESGAVRLEFEPVTGKEVRLTLTPFQPQGGKARTIALAGVQLEGWTESTIPPVSGTMTLNLIDVRDRSKTLVTKSSVTLKAGERKVISSSCSLPSSEDVRFYRLETEFEGQHQSLPVMSLPGHDALPPLNDLVPHNCADLGFIVTEGFRNCFPLGSGTVERTSSWASPDDLIFAYSRQMKEVGANARTLASRLYVTEGDMRHYSQPWRTFGNGLQQFAEAAPNLVAAMRRHPNWPKSDVAKLSNSDRWDTGPQVGTLHGWQDFVEFDAHLRATGSKPLVGKTRQEIAKEIHSEREDEWQAWQLDRYLLNLRTLRNTFAAEGKRLLITAQGCPVISGPAGLEISQTVQGMSDDCTWGMEEASITYTTGRQLAESSHNPVWKMSTLLQYGFNTPILNSPEWHSPIGTMEATRRHYYNRAWRGILWNDGIYRSPYFAGYNENVGLSYQMNENDWTNWWRIEERHSLLRPELPLGAGLVMSTNRFADPRHTRFTSGNVFAGSTDAQALARVFQRLTDAGLSIPFSANASVLSLWKGSAPLIVILPEVFLDEELRSLEELQRRGVRMVAFTEATDMSPRVAALFRGPGTLIRISPASLTVGQAGQLAPKLCDLLDLPLRFPAGVTGYGFGMSGTKFVVVEDLRCEGRRVDVQLRARDVGSTVYACAANDHRELAVRRDGLDLIIEVPLRPGDAELVAVTES